MNKQTEEMARTLCGEKKNTCEECNSCDMCEFWVEASTLHSAGYRKQSEVAREIFEEIERVAMSKIDENAPISTLDDILYIQAIDEVRQKYTEGEQR